MRSPGGGGGSDDPGRSGRQVPAEEAGRPGSRTRERRRYRGAERRDDVRSTYRRIVVPLDGTPFAETALTPAAALATRAGAVLDLVSVMARGEGGTDFGAAVPTAEPGSLEFESTLEQYVLRKMEEIESEWGCEVTSGVLPEGEAGVALRSYMDRSGADLSVLAARANGEGTSGLLGSLSGAFRGDAPCPTLLVPSDERGTEESELPLHGPVGSVAAILDGVEGRDREVLDHALRMARLWGAPLRVLGTGEGPADVAARAEELGGRDVDVRVETAAERRGEPGATRRGEAAAEPDDELRAFLDRHEAALVCVAAARERPLGLLFGSDAPEVDGKDPSRTAAVLLCACG